MCFTLSAYSRIQFFPLIRTHLRAFEMRRNTKKIQSFFSAFVQIHIDRDANQIIDELMCMCLVLSSCLSLCVCVCAWVCLWYAGRIKPDVDKHTAEWFKWKMSLCRLHFIDASFHWKWIVLIHGFGMMHKIEFSHWERYRFFLTDASFSLLPVWLCVCVCVWVCCRCCCFFVGFFKWKATREFLLFSCAYNCVLSPDVIYQKCHFHLVPVVYRLQWDTVVCLPLRSLCATLSLSLSVWSQSLLRYPFPVFTTYHRISNSTHTHKHSPIFIYLFVSYPCSLYLILFLFHIQSIFSFHFLQKIKTQRRQKHGCYKLWRQICLKYYFNTI